MAFGRLNWPSLNWPKLNWPFSQVAFEAVLLAFEVGKTGHVEPQVSDELKVAVQVGEVGQDWPFLVAFFVMENLGV